MANEFPILSRQQVAVERRFGAPLPTLLARLYIHDGLTFPQIAEHLGVSLSTVNRWMKAAGIVTTTRGAGAVKAVA